MYFRKLLPQLSSTRIFGRHSSQNISLELPVSLSKEADLQNSPSYIERACAEKIGKRDSDEDLFEKLADAVTPLWKVPYEEQLKIKDERNFAIMKKLTERLKLDSDRGNILCQLTKTLPSPATLHYRNKNEFHVKYDTAGKVVVGLCIGKASENSLQCVNADKLLNTSNSHSTVARYFQEYVNHSQWKVCEHFQHGGNWRHLTVRSNYKNDLMLVITIHPQQLSSEEIHSEMLRLKDYLLSCPIPQLTSIYYQSCEHTRCTAEQSPFVLLHGEQHIFERIGKFEFRISPESFFQVNTEAAQVLYDTVARQLNPSRLSTVIDLCCGTGTQGLMVANRCRGVVGIEMSRSAVQDARFNAAHNQIHNAEFYAGRVEKLFPALMKQLETAPEICAILNPSRSGVDNRLIQLLRDNDRIRRIIYVSCQPDGPAMRNFAGLCQRPTKKMQSEPFRLQKATPVDMFPHTDHCEMVLSFNR